MELLLQVGTFCVAVGALVAGMPFKRYHEYPIGKSSLNGRYHLQEKKWEE